MTKLNSRRAQKGKRENLNFTRIGQGGQTLTIRPQDGADASFFGFTKAAKIAKMTPNDLLTLEMIFTEPLRGKNEFHGNISTYDIEGSAIFGQKKTRNEWEGSFMGKNS